MTLRDIIPPEIKDDELSQEIIKLCRTFKPETALEVGSSTGEGSTQAFIEGIAGHGTLYCIEASKPRYEQLVQNTAMHEWVKPYHTASVRPDESMTRREVSLWFGLLDGLINLPVMEIGEERVIGWLDNEDDIIDDTGTPRNGIRRIKKENDIDVFDIVLIDGSPFTAMAELALVYGAGIIIMDDIMGVKCFEAHHRMQRDRHYRLYKENKHLRNGYSIWIRK